MITQIKKTCPDATLGDYTDYRKFFISVILSALLLILSFPPFNLSFFAWFALIPLFFLTPATNSKAGRPSNDTTAGRPSNDTKAGRPAAGSMADKHELSPRKIFILYFGAGIIFWLYHIWWLTYVTFLGYFTLVIYLAFFMGLFGLLLKFLKEKTQYPLLFLAPPLWILFEFLRTYFAFGFPWSLLGYSQWMNIPLIQISSTTGIYGVSFLIVMFNAAFYDLYFYKTKKSLIALITTFLIVAGVMVIGEKTILEAENQQTDKIKISVIQGNIPQTEKWVAGYSERIVNTYAELSIYAGKEPNISLVIWPETSYPDYAEVGSPLFQKVQNLIYYLNTPLLMGAATQQNGRKYNSALLISPSGEIKQTYNKIHLVPFGEYTPLRKIFFFLNNTNPPIGDFSKGSEYTVFQIPNTKHQKPSFAVLICFEDLFPDLSRKFTEEGADFLINITNDAHFHDSPALWQHFTHSVFRAVENHRPVIRASNNGISGFIDSYGRPIKILNENGKTVGISGFVTSEISPVRSKLPKTITAPLVQTSNGINPSSHRTLYTRFGNLFVYFNIFYLMILSIIAVKKSIHPHTPACCEAGRKSVGMGGKKL